ncbi:hypothetical protein AAL_01828 [Moelleriella libera RCEF 2490]|uniref:Uncharacterized protein n=1 Tax=Moelleriella libera RCEF 2490 TaxID=1081109 RepID=A0A168EXR9_9HYPO|nr:hypothetical protein AAL_01828 [Moelleriella libera RCEF 2490]
MSPPLIHEALFQQMSILDFFLPGFSNIIGNVSQALNGNMSRYTHLVCIFAILAFLRRYVSQLGFWFMKYFSWTSSRGLENAALSLLATIKTRQAPYGEHENGMKKFFRYAPWEGDLCLWYNWTLLLYQSALVDVGFNKEERVSVTCFG